MKKYILFILLAFCCKAGNSQKQGQEAIDSMLNDLPKAKEDTNKVLILKDLSYAYSTIKPDEGIKYGQQALKLATKLGWIYGIALANNSLGGNYLSKSDFPKALECFLKALKINEEMLDKNNIANATGNIGSVYANLNDFHKALEYYFKSLKIYEEIGDKYGIAMVTGNIGNIYYKQNDSSKALEYYYKSLKMNEEIGYTYGVAFFTGNIGDIYEDLHDYIKALEFYFKSLKMNDKLGDKYITAIDNVNIGGAYLSIVKDTTQSNKEINNAEKYKNDKIPLSKTARLLIAIDYLQRGIAIANEINAPDVLQKGYERLSEAFNLSGDYKKAMKYATDYKYINDSIFSKENNLKIGIIENAYTRLTDSLIFVKKDKINALRLQRQRIFLYAGLSMGLIVILVLLIFSFFITKERRKSEKLLLNILPSEVAKELKSKGIYKTRNYENVTVLFTDFKQFTELSEKMSPTELVAEVNECFSVFDNIMEKYNIEKIKTIGDSYMAAGGLPTPNKTHPEDIVHAALEIQEFMQKHKQERKAKGRLYFEIRTGIHTGPVVAGIVGVKKFQYDIWGDTVNTASRMESSGEAGKVNISGTTYELVKDKFTCTYRGKIEAKGKGEIDMYFVEGVA